MTAVHNDFCCILPSTRRLRLCLRDLDLLCAGRVLLFISSDFVMFFVLYLGEKWTPFQRIWSWHVVVALLVRPHLNNFSFHRDSLDPRKSKKKSDLSIWKVCSSSRLSRPSNNKIMLIWHPYCLQHFFLGYHAKSTFFRVPATVTHAS